MNLYDLEGSKPQRPTKDNKIEVVYEFAQGGGGDSGDYLRALASAWYNDTYNTGSLQKGIKSQEDVERLKELETIRIQSENYVDRKGLYENIRRVWDTRRCCKNYWI